MLAAGAGHRLLGIALRVGLPVRHDVIARDFLNGFADRKPHIGGIQTQAMVPEATCPALSIDARVVDDGERSPPSQLCEFTIEGHGRGVSLDRLHDGMCEGKVALLGLPRLPKSLDGFGRGVDDELFGQERLGRQVA